MNEIYEALKGFTDLPITVIAFVLGILLRKKQTIKGFDILFFGIAICGIIGAAVHIFKVSVTTKNIIWVFLYPLLYEVVRRVGVLFYRYITKTPCAKRKFISALQAFLCLCSVITMILFDKYDMLFLAVFSAVSILRILLAVKISEHIPKKVAVVLLFAVFTVLLQTFSKVIPYAVVFEHTVIAALLIVTYFIAKEDRL